MWHWEMEVPSSLFQTFTFAGPVSGEATLPVVQALNGGTLFPDPTMRPKCCLLGNSIYFVFVNLRINSFLGGTKAFILSILSLISLHSVVNIEL